MAVRALKVNVPGGAYPVAIGEGARMELPRLLAKGGRDRRIHLVTDSRVARRYRGLVEALLSRRGFTVSTTVVPAGEKSKSVSTLSRIWRDLARSGCDRSACVVALGGGVVGDLAGFAAASALRGIDFVQVPTTLLAMVDASVGGKTGINLPEGKNLVGAFHQPRAVVMDLAFLRTLPEREARAGWAEVIKTAAIRDVRLFARLERERERLVAREPRALSVVIERCCRIKADVVRRDERESGLRMILNFGHTLAHGLEGASRYGGLLHGEAVSIGMVFASELGEALGKTRRGTATRLTALLEAFGLPVRAASVPVERLLEIMGRDKKRGSRGLRWVLLSRIGSAQIVEGVEPAFVEKRIREFLRA